MHQKLIKGVATKSYSEVVLMSLLLLLIIQHLHLGLSFFTLMTSWVVN